jgi:uncharacterized iron-regulated membrane protein
MRLRQRLLIYSRQWHRWGALLASAPLLLTILTGLLLMQRGQLDWVQPPAQTGQAKQVAPMVSAEAALEILKTLPEAEVQSWQEISQLTYRPAKGVWQARLKNQHEVQLDASTGEVLSSQYRLSTLLIQLHEGSWFGKPVMYWVFFPSGLILLMLWLTGLWLYFGPLLQRKNPYRKQQET